MDGDHPVTDDDYVESELAHTQRAIAKAIAKREEEGGEADAR